MKRYSLILLTGFFLLLFSGVVQANEVEGPIEKIDESNQSFTALGIQFLVTPSTEYKDDLKSFDDLREGQVAEVDFEYRDGKHYALEVEVQVNEVEGRIEMIDKNDQSFTALGIQFLVTSSTEYEDDLKSFDDLRDGQEVEVDFEYRDGKHYALEVELE